MDEDEKEDDAEHKIEYADDEEEDYSVGSDPEISVEEIDPEGVIAGHEFFAQFSANGSVSGDDE